MKKRICMIMSAILAASMVMAACGSSDSTTEESSSAAESESTSAEETAEDSSEDSSSGDGDLLVYIADITNESQGYSAKQFEAYASEYGFEVEIMSDDGDAQQQSTAIGNAVTAGADVIFVNPVDISAVVPALQSAKDAGVLIGLYSSDLAEEDQDVRDFFIGANDDDAGRFAAEAFNEQFPDGATIVEVMGQTGHDATIKRHSGFENYKNDNIEVLDSQGTTQWATAEAMSIMEDFIVMYGDEIDGVFCHWDNGATGVIEALSAAGMEDVFLVAVDGCAAGFEQVMSGDQAVTIMQNFVTMVQQSLEVARAALDGEDYEVLNYIDFDVVTLDNIDEFEMPEW